MRRFLEEDDDSPYYETGYPADPDAAFRDKLVPLVHGPDMDVFPDTVPPANIERAAKILEQWKASRPGSDLLAHDQAWVDFLRGDYAQAVRRFLDLAGKIDRGEITDGWVRFDTYVNLGRSYDVLGQREKALASYGRAAELMTGTRWERMKDYVLRDYRKAPFKRAQPKKGP